MSSIDLMVNSSEAKVLQKLIIDLVFDPLPETETHLHARRLAVAKLRKRIRDEGYANGDPSPWEVEILASEDQLASG